MSEPTTLAPLSQVETEPDVLETFRAEHLAGLPFTTKQIAYLLALARIGYIEKSYTAVPVSRQQVKEWRHDPAFREMEEHAKAIWVERLERVADALAFDGTEVPLIGRVGKDQDGIITTIRKYDSKLIEFRLRALAPDRYADRRKTELSGPGGGPIQIQPVVDRLKDRVEQLAQRRAELAARGGTERSEPGGTDEPGR